MQDTKKLKKFKKKKKEEERKPKLSVTWDWKAGKGRRWA